MSDKISIIGGGIIGCSIAYYLTKRGIKDIQLFEMEQLGSASTGSSAAMVMHQTGNKQLSELAQFSINEYLNTIIYNENFEFHRTGSILFANDDETCEEIREMIELQCLLGIDTVELNPEEIKKLAPMVETDKIIMGSYCSEDGYVDPGQIVKNYSKYAKANGAQIKTRTTVNGIEVDDRKVKGVYTDRGFFESSIIINAAGPLAHMVGQYAGIEIPLENNKRDILIVEPENDFGEFPIMEDVATEWYFRSEGSNVLIGIGDVTEMPVDPENLECHCNSDCNYKNAEYFINFVPSMGYIIDKWAGIRSLTKDDKMPIIGPVDSLEGFYIASPGCAFGVTTAPAIGKIIADLIIDGSTDIIDIEQFLLSRFDYNKRQKDL